MQSQRQEIQNLKPLEDRQESLTDLLGNLANQSASLVRDEVALAKQELSEKFAAFRASVTVLAVGAFVGLLSALALCAAAIAGLSVFLTVWQAALLVGLLLAGIAGIVIATGLAHLKKASLRPEKTIETLEENKEWLKELT